MVIQLKPTRCPDEQPKMRSPFSLLRGVALGQIVPHLQEDGEIGLEDQPAFIRHLEAAFGDPNRVATAEQRIWKINQKNRAFSQYYAEFQTITVDLDLKPSASTNALRMG